MTSASNGQPVVEARDVSFAYRRKNLILDHLNLRVDTGELVVIQGSSGEGKTTLLNCILGLLTPTAGTITICGKQINKLKREQRATVRREHVGVIFQRGGLIDGLTAEENVALPTLLAGPNTQIIKHAETLLESMGVPTGRDVNDLSGGEYQRTAMARALINEPHVLVADEPTASLDPKMRDLVYELLVAATRERNTGTIIVTHDENAQKYATRVLHLARGTLTQQ